MPNVIEKIKTLSYQGEPIKVSGLPEELRLKVDKLQDILQKKVDIIFDLELVEMANKALIAEINMDLAILLSKPKESTIDITKEEKEGDSI